MVNAELGTAQAGEVAFRPIGAAAFRASKLDRVVDALHGEAGVKHIPATGFVSVNFGARSDMLADHRHRGAFPRDDPRHRAAMALAGDNDDLAAAFVAAVAAVSLAVLLPPAPAEISAV